MTDEKAKQLHDERERREQEEKQKKYQEARIAFNLALLDLGLDEEPALQYTQQGIVPTVKVIAVTPEQAEENRTYLLKLKADMDQMGSGIIVEQ